MTPDSYLFVNQLRLEFSFLVSSNPLPWVLAQPHLRAFPNTIAASFLLSSSSFHTFILLHGSLINSAWLLLGFLTLEDGLIRRRHIPSYYNRELMYKFQRLQQRNMSVEKYRQKMKLLMMRVGIIEKEAITIARLLSGLNLDNK